MALSKIVLKITALEKKSAKMATEISELKKLIEVEAKNEGKDKSAIVKAKTVANKTTGKKRGRKPKSAQAI